MERCYSDAIEDKIDLIMAELKRKYPNLTNYRWHAIKLLEQDKEISARYSVNLPDVIDRNYESDIINEKYDFIQEIIKEVLVNKDRQDALTEKVDRVLTHKVWSIPIFLVVMAAVFFLTFTIGDWLKGFLELGIEGLSALISDGLHTAGVNEVLCSLLVDGIVAGVGGILTFLPNIFILFLALAFLEDSGYMARVAYVMEGIMSKLGLSGRAFIPMILGFGCTVPAIMASRSLENRRDRFKVMLITPFMSCSARLPIYILFAEMFFQERAMLVAYSMYLIGLVVAILVAAIIHLIDRKKSENYLLIELPEYKAPSARTVAIYVWEKVKDYLTKAGTTIFIASILMWVILNFGPHGYTTEMADSFGSILGHGLVPIFEPIGLGFWQIAVALIAGISAKEVVVSSCAVLFGIPNINSGAGMDTLVMDKVLPDGWYEGQRAAFRQAIEDKGNWYQLILKAYQLDEGVRKTFFQNFIINSALKGSAIQQEIRERENCNVPWAILLDPTSACNLHCTGCWAAEYGHKLNLSLETIDRIIRQGKELGIYMYIYTGGEPMVRKKDLITLCERHPDCEFLSFTNGTLIDEAFCQEMLRVKNFVPAISLEGFEQANDGRRGQGVFEKVMKAMDLLREHKLPFGISTCYTSANYADISSEQFFNMMIDMGAMFVWFFHYMPVGNDAVPELLPTPEQRKAVYERIRAFRSTKPIFSMDFQNDAEYVGGCIAGGRNYLHINAAGDVEPCVFIHYSNVNIHDCSLLDALKSPIFMAYHDGQPFNKNMLRPCPMLENPQLLREMVKRTGAKSTDLQSPEPVDHLCDKCEPYAANWKPVADELWDFSRKGV